jgi:hypothetical protein
MTELADACISPVVVGPPNPEQFNYITQMPVFQPEARLGYEYGLSKKRRARGLTPGSS